MLTRHNMTHNVICSINLNYKYSYKHSGTIWNLSSISLPNILFSLQLIKCNQKCTLSSKKGTKGF